MKNKKGILKYYIGAFLMQFLAVGVCIGCHRAFIHLGSQIAPSEIINGEATSPTTGRLIYVFVSFFAFLVLTVIASKLAGKNKDFASFSLGIFAGIFLWQSIGEDAWHFSVGGMHFACLESVSVLPIAVLFALFMIYCAKHKGPDFGVWCAILSFATNWFGHYVLLGIYPFFESVVDKALWCKVIGIALGSITIIAGIILGIVKSKTDKQKMLSSILTYYGVGVMMFGFIG